MYLNIRALPHSFLWCMSDNPGDNTFDFASSSVFDEDPMVCSTKDKNIEYVLCVNMYLWYSAAARIMLNREVEIN